MVDLNEEDDLNTLTLASRQEIWIPQVIFFNTEIKKETVNDEKAFATVKRSGNFTRRSIVSNHNAYLQVDVSIFAPIEAMLQVSRR